MDNEKLMETMQIIKDNEYLTDEDKEQIQGLYAHYINTQPKEIDYEASPLLRQLKKELDKYTEQLDMAYAEEDSDWICKLQEAILELDKEVYEELLELEAESQEG